MKQFFLQEVKEQSQQSAYLFIAGVGVGPLLAWNKKE